MEKLEIKSIYENTKFWNNEFKVFMSIYILFTVSFIVFLIIKGIFDFSIENSQIYLDVITIMVAPPLIYNSFKVQNAEKLLNKFLKEDDEKLKKNNLLQKEKDDIVLKKLKEDIDKKIKKGEHNFKNYSMDELLNMSKIEFKLVEYENEAYKKRFDSLIEESKQLIKELKEEKNINGNEIPKKSTEILEDFYKFEEKFDSSWKASKESKILYGKLEFLYKYSNKFSSEDFKEVEYYFLENDDGILVKTFNTIRWKIRKSIGERANGLFSLTEFYYIDWLSKPFVLKEQSKEELTNHLNIINCKIADLEFLNIESYQRENLYTSIGIKFNSEIEENKEEIIALKASYSNIEKYIIKYKD